MLGDVTVEYNDYNSGEDVEEDFEDVESVSTVGNPDAPGDAIIIAHAGEHEPNTVRSGVVLKSVA